MSSFVDTCVYLNMKKKGWILGLFLFLLVGISVAVRVYYVMRLMGDVQISTTDIFFNIVYQVLTIVIVFFVVSSFSNKDIGFGTGLVVSVLPMYVSQIAYISFLNLAIFLGALVLIIVTCILQKFFKHIRYEEQETENIAQKISNISLNFRVMRENASSKTEEQGVYAKPQMDTSLKEIRLDDLEELEDKDSQLIENPLPASKGREHREMDYAVEISIGNDDFDLKDLSGKDFFDIE